MQALVLRLPLATTSTISPSAKPPSPSRRCYPLLSMKISPTLPPAPRPPLTSKPSAPPAAEGRRTAQPSSLWYRRDDCRSNRPRKRKLILNYASQIDDASGTLIANFAANYNGAERLWANRAWLSAFAP